MRLKPPPPRVFVTNTLNTVAMDPAIWGPKSWDVLFVSALRMEPAAVVPLIEAYAECLPCIHCRRSFKMYQKQMPCESMSDTSDNLFRWIWVMHDMVNQKLGKQSLSFDKTRRRYTSFSSYISCVDVTDVLTCMACCAHAERNLDGLEKLAQCLPEVRALFAGNHVIGGAAVAGCVPIPAGGCVREDIMTMRRKVRDAFDMPRETREQALLRFPASQSAAAAPAAAPRRRPMPIRRRRAL